MFKEDFKVAFLSLNVFYRDKNCLNLHWLHQVGG